MSYPAKKACTHWFPIELFEDHEAGKKYQCRLCEQVPSCEFTSIHSQCGAIFCISCIISWLFGGNDCPKCGKPFKPTLLLNENKLASERQQKLIIKCPWHEKCRWKGKMADMLEHKQRTTIQKYVITVEKVVPKKVKRRKVQQRRKSMDAQIVKQLYKRFWICAVIMHKERGTITRHFQCHAPC
eukprot:TRINITY_DN2592_c0_g1_i1.p1 TRINITY_DN2592_c0_g1~~TRINITY_DN2592_c0_g1_i1.p1  ORF type:complete len:184 (+),score=7.40 TRINITY_DN2592_c0_g1_i1:109-660(+)